MESIWHKTAEMQTYSHLQGDLTAQAVVIGGGLAGILTAFFLQQHNIDTIVLEASHIGSGQTKNTTAKITSQHNLIYHKLITSFGKEKAQQYAKANEQAIAEYGRIIEEYAIDCDFEKRPAYLYTLEAQAVQHLADEAEAAKQLGIDAAFTSDTKLPFSVAGAVKFDHQAQFHPLKFLQAIAEKVKVFTQTRVISAEGNRVLTDRGTVTAEHIVFATHFPMLNIPGFYFARMHQERSYVLALQNAAQLDGMYRGIDQNGLSFRNFGEMLLLGGGNHRTGENSAGGKYDYLRDRASLFYPQSTVLARWSAQDCMTHDGIPYIGQFSASTPSWHVATGFGKWGMTTSMVSAMLICDRICGRSNDYAEVFSPLRFASAASIKPLAADIGQAVKGLSRQVFSPPRAELEALLIGHGGVIEYNGQKIGAYKEDADNIHLVSIRCPHMGCQLEWNPDEKSWDCPCHGSRFDYKGNLLDNPAQEDLASGHKSAPS